MNRPDTHRAASATPENTLESVAATLGDGLQRAADAGTGRVRQLAAQAELGVERWREQALALRSDTRAQIRAYPLRSVALAAATGMLVTLLMRALRR